MYIGTSFSTHGSPTCSTYILHDAWHSSQADASKNLHSYREDLAHWVIGMPKTSITILFSFTLGTYMKIKCLHHFLVIYFIGACFIILQVQIHIVKRMI